MTVQILKFGGTSVKSIARIEHVARLVAAGPFDKKIVVVSAMGDTTDYLSRLARQCSTEPDKRELDLLLSTGEQVSITLLTLVLRSLGVNARSFTGRQIGIATDNTHGDARVLTIDKDALEESLTSYDVIVVAGFQGISKDGEVTTLGRGGSDTTAVALAAAAGAPRCDIYSDVDGVCTSDPNLIANTSVLNEISFDEAASIARSGADVIHPRAVELAQKYGIEIHARNTFRPDEPGTIIREFAQMEERRSCYAVALSEKEACVRLARVPQSFPVTQLAEPLVADNLKLRTLAEADNGKYRALSLVVGFQEEQEIYKVVQKIEKLLPSVDATIDLDLARVSLIGQTVSIDGFTTSRFLSALRAAGIDASQIDCSDNVLSCIVRKSEAVRACQLVHDSFHAQSQSAIFATA